MTKGRNGTPGLCETLRLRGFAVRPLLRISYFALLTLFYRYFASHDTV
jgi:hypothetical protein